MPEEVQVCDTVDNRHEADDSQQVDTAHLQDLNQRPNLQTTSQSRAGGEREGRGAAASRKRQRTIAQRQRGRGSDPTARLYAAQLPYSPAPTPPLGVLLSPADAGRGESGVSPGGVANTGGRSGGGGLHVSLSPAPATAAYLHIYCQSSCQNCL